MNDPDNDFTVALNGVDAPPECPSCRKDAGWSKPEFSLLVDFTKLPKQRFTEKDGLIVVAASCGSCGFIRAHSADHLCLLDEARGIA